MTDISLLIILSVTAAVSFAAAIAGFFLAGSKSRALASLSAKLSEAESYSAEISTKYVVALDRLGATEKSLDETKGALEKSFAGKIESEKALSAAREKISALESKISDGDKDAEALRKKLSDDFAILSNRIFEDARVKIAGASGEKMAGALEPLRSGIADFRARLEELNKSALADRAGMSAHIKSLMEMNSRLSSDAQSLADALKGNNKIAGNWGEVTLERIFQFSGLKKGIHYESQKSYADANGQQKRLVPDFVVKLPNSRAIIVDSKVSLVDYAAWFEATEPYRKREAVEKFKRSVRAHLDEFADKYNDIAEANCGFKLMFMPIDGAWELAAEEDPKLFSDAYAKNVLIVNPTSVMSVLKFAEIVVRNAALEKNTREISDLAAKLVERVEGFRERFETMGQRIGQLSDIYTKTKLSLSDGSQSVMKTASRLALKYRGESVAPENQEEE